MTDTKNPPSNPPKAPGNLLDVTNIPAKIYSKEDAEDIFTQTEFGGHVGGEQALWRAVIMQALMDAGSNSKKRQMRYARAQAISWLGVNSEDFITVCALAGLDPIYVRTKAKEAIKRGCVWRTIEEGKVKQKVTAKKKLPIYEVIEKKQTTSPKNMEYKSTVVYLTIPSTKIANVG